MSLFSDIDINASEDNISIEWLYRQPHSLWLNELFSDKVESLKKGNVIKGENQIDINTKMKTPFFVEAMNEMWGKVPGNWACIKSVVDIKNKECRAFVYECVESAEKEIVDSTSFNVNLNSKESFSVQYANSSFTDEELKFLSQRVVNFFVYISSNDKDHVVTNSYFCADTLVFLGGYKLNYETSGNGKLEFDRKIDELALRPVLHMI